MNQILQIGTKKNKPTDIKKVLIFFSISVIIFGVILLGQGVYNAIINYNNPDADQPVTEETPKIDISRQEDTITVKVTHTKPLTKLTYTWNEEEPVEIDAQNRNEIEEKIELPVGTNKLHVNIVDINGNETQYDKEYIVEGNGKPIIKLSLMTRDNKIKISVADGEALKNLSYSWNNGEAINIPIDETNPKQVEKQIEIPLGQNTLKVTAINSKDVTTIKELEVKGIKKPVVQVVKEGDYLLITATDEVGLQSVDYTLNGKAYQLNFGQTKVIQYKQLLEDGENVLILKAYNVDGGITEYKGKCVK